MPMDSQTKSAIKSLVLDLRHTLEDELAIVLKRYGLFTDRKWSLEEPPERLTDDADREIWRRIVAVVRRGMKEGRTLPEASQDYVRESAFTFLNRLVGLKCLEVRGIIDEVITTRDIYGGRSKAHRDYRDEHPRQARAPDDALPACLEAVCRRVNDELIGYLFDPDDDHSLVWPRYAILKTCIEKINGLDESVWAEDEIIGWIYQFYNAEEKVAVRKRGKPQTPHDVAVINQFFTPRWVVKFLVDNTLGRLWLEMHPDSERVRAKCDYLVPEPLPADDSEVGNRKSQIMLDPDSPINNPHAAPRREATPITRIRLLDPACGTMHFGHYACEVFDAMYRDARDWSEVEIEDERIPSAILEYNLFGVDIDRRAVQLAALSLFMKARTMHPDACIRQVNLVVADATMPDSGVKKRFLARYARDKRVQRAFAQVLDDMDQVAQVGSLLRVEERLRELLTRARHAAVASELDLRRQRELPGMEPDVRQMGLAETVGEDEAAAWTPHYTLQELRDDLRAFAREALQEHDVNAELFATEADKAVRLLDVLMGEYDVVVMNPPYGGTTGIAKEYLKSAYPRTKNDLYATFFSKAIDFTQNGGYVGSLTSRTFFGLATFRKLREEVILQQAPPVVALDLGFGVLDDAMVETAATVLGWKPRQTHGKDQEACFFRVINREAKQEVFESAFQAWKSEEKTSFVYQASVSDFLALPEGNLTYWAPRSLIRRFSTHPPLSPTFGDLKRGLFTSSDKRFLRHWWEVPLDQMGPQSKWVPFSKGGDFSRYYYDPDLVVFWESDGAAMKECIINKYTYLKGNYGWCIPNEDAYLSPGITYPLSTVKGFNARRLPSGYMWGHVGPVLVLKDDNLCWSVLGLLNSEITAMFLDMITIRNFETGYVSNLPVVKSEKLSVSDIGKAASDAHSLKSTWDTGNEICTRFTTPWLLQLAQPQGEAFSQDLGGVLELLGDDAPQVPTSPDSTTLTDLLDRARAIEDAADARLQALQTQIDQAVYDLYEISPADRELIERELGDRPPELVWPQMGGKSDKEKRREHIRRFFSYFALQAVCEDEDGVVPLAGCGAREPYLVDRVRSQLEARFGPGVAYQMEQDAATYLGRPLEEWLHRYFFHQFHVKLYKKRPILWHLTSDKKYFAVMLDYHKLTRDTLPKVQTLYLWPQMEAARTRLAAARADQTSVKAISDLEDELADLEDCNARLESVIQGTVEVDLPEWATGPYRGGQAPYNPDLDDGIKANLLPLQEAGLLPVRRVV